jgi:general secretion pathway protein E
MTTTSHDAELEQLVSLLVNDALDERATDVHLNSTLSGLRLRYRIDGTLRPVRDFAPSLRDAMPQALSRLAHLEHEREGRLRVARPDGSEVQVRVSVMPSVQGPNVVLRVLDCNAVPLKLDNLGMPPETLKAWRALLAKPHGLLIITAPTGRGKTTTAYASLAEMATPQRNVVTVEPQVEHVFDWAVQMPAADGVAATLRGVCNQDPDVIYCAEIPDAETADLLCKLSMSGHLVLACMHADDAAGALERLQTVAGVPTAMVHAAVSGVLSQDLAPRVCDGCVEGSGCPRCGGTGFHGRVATFDLQVGSVQPPPARAFT